MVIERKELREKDGQRFAVFTVDGSEVARGIPDSVETQGQMEAYWRSIEDGLAIEYAAGALEDPHVVDVVDGKVVRRVVKVEKQRPALVMPATK